MAVSTDWAGVIRARPDGRPFGRVRADALPEHTRYRDDGCDIHPHCLTCPLPRCRYDEPGGLRAMLNAQRDREIVEMRLRGVPVDDLAGRFGVSRRTVFRVLSAPAGARGDAQGGIETRFVQGRAFTCVR